MKKIIFCLIGLLLFCSTALADRGVVVKAHDDKYAIEYSMGYLLVEWFGGYAPSEGDTYVGDFSGFGFKELYCINVDSVTNFWVEDFMADKDTALEFLFD